MIPPKANVERQNPISPLIQCGGQDESDDSEEATLEAKPDGVAVPEDTHDVVGQPPDAELFVHESPPDDSPPISDSQQTTLMDAKERGMRSLDKACFNMFHSLPQRMVTDFANCLRLLMYQSIMWGSVFSGIDIDAEATNSFGNIAFWKRGSSIYKKKDE